MRIRRLLLAVLCTSWGLAAILAAPHPAAAQCTMRGGGGHDHSAMDGQAARKHSASERKLQQSIDRLLSDDRGRTMLADALLSDRAFMESFIRRIGTIPEWRSPAAGQFTPAPRGDSLEAAAPEAYDEAAAIFVCPMHRDVTSSKPGECPKCGMQLVRSPSNHK